MAEPEASRRSRVGAAVDAVLGVRDRLEQAELVLRLLLERLGRFVEPTAPLPLPFSFWFARMSSVSIPASASTWWRRSFRARGEPRALLVEDALEPEHQAIANLPPV